MLRNDKFCISRLGPVPQSKVDNTLLQGVCSAVFCNDISAARTLLHESSSECFFNRRVSTPFGGERSLQPFQTGSLPASTFDQLVHAMHLGSNPYKGTPASASWALQGTACFPSSVLWRALQQRRRRCGAEQ